MKRYEYTDNPVEDIMEDMHDGFQHEGSLSKKLFLRPLILLVSVIVACLVAIALGYGSAWVVVLVIQPMPVVSSLPYVLAIPFALFAIGTPIGVVVAGFTIVYQYMYVALRRRAKDACDERVIIPVRILNDLSA
ncbi:hypothetical protein HY625_01440 [Candidatus Uhrbacteria bacterium]|nr:hypothetical protein [Candidatus Uhrbacteria bacterium]